jgi:aspartate racemase
MYTSGSTGRPKGVAVPHRAVVRLVRGASFMELGPEERFLQLAPISFDASTLEIWGALLNGGTLVLFPGDLPELGDIARVLREERITVLWLTAGLFHQMVDHHLEELRSVRQLLAGGDVLSARHVQAVLRERETGLLVNGYGPTENTTFSACYTMTGGTLLNGSVPIGRPLANSSADVLDPDLELLPAGIPGELYVGGDGLARGYLNQPDLTAERFVPDPLGREPGARLYRTGDRARWRSDGNLEFLGRLDAQLKIRGFRVEPGEIEAVLEEHPAVGGAVVVAQPSRSGDVFLAAYVVPAAGLVSGAELSAWLRDRLPAFMQPSSVTVLPEWPLTPNGKIDRRHLPAPEMERKGRTAANVAPRNQIEASLVQMWEELLGVEHISIYDSFFELGGHSLIATQVISRVRQEHGTAPPLRILFEEPTIARLAAAIIEEIEEKGARRAVPEIPILRRQHRSPGSQPSAKVPSKS